MPDVALDATAEALTRRILAELPADRPRGAADIDRLPAPLVPLLHSRLAVAVDAVAPASSSWIDAEAIRDATAEWRRAALAAARIPANVWPEAVREAVGLALAHLIRPADTLAAFAFSSGVPALPIADALDRARTFGPYPYLPQIAARYAARKDLDLIDRAGLEQLFRRIDRRMVSTFGPDDWTTLLGPLLDLVGPVGSPPGAIPTALLRPLFMTKGVGTLAVELEGIDAVSAEELRTLLERTLVPTDASPQPETDEPAHQEAPAHPPEASDDRDETLPPDERVSAPPPLAPAPLPPVAEGVRPPTIGSKYLAPEYDDHDESEVLGPPVPIGSAPADEEEEPVIEALPMESLSMNPAEAAPLNPERRAAEPETHDAEADTSLDDWIHDGGAKAPEAEARPAEAHQLDQNKPETDAPDSDTDDRSLHGSDPMAEVRDALTDPLAEEPSADDAPELTRGSNPQIQPEPASPPETAPARTVADAFIFPDEEPDPEPAPAPAPPGPDDDDASLTGAPAFGDEPLWKQLVRERRDEPPAPAAAPASAQEDAPDDDEPLWKQFAKSELAAKLPSPEGLETSASPELDALEARVLGPGARERRDWYVTELFDGSPSVYHRTLARIDRSASYSDATDIISSDILRAYTVDPYTESMVAFIDAVQDHFGRR